jgi:hypothetical protein
MQTQNGIGRPGETSPFVVSLASRARRHRSSRARAELEGLRSSRLYYFPQRTAHEPLKPAALIVSQQSCESSREASATFDKPTLPPSSIAARPSPAKRFETRHALLFGVLACYALILFNLVYGLTALARLKAWTAVPAGQSVAGGQAPSLNIKSLLSSVLAPGLCRTEPSFDQSQSRRRFSLSAH